MKSLIFTATLLLSISYPCSSQENERDTLEVTKNIVWFSPSKATHINGVLFTVFPVLVNENTRNCPKINGIEFEISPISVFFPFLMAMYSLDPNTHEPISTKIKQHEKADFKEINGIHIGLGDIINKKWVNGIDISATGSFETVVNGASISAVMNKHYKINGLSLAAMGNHDVECNGIQLGLINSAIKLRGFQFGLWNKNQKRSFPLFNWAFSQ